MYSIGAIFESNNYGSFKIVEYLGKNKKWVHVYKITFIATGYTTIVQHINIKLGRIKDKLKPTICGVGYQGEGVFKVTALHKKILNLWFLVLRRCYDKGSVAYKYYGAKGIRVCDAWHNYTNFYNDIITLDGYNEGLIISGSIELDKDKLQLDVNLSSRIYSKQTCCFISHKENSSVEYTSSRYVPIIVTYPDGTEEEVVGILPFAKKAGLHASNISHCLAGKSKTVKGHKFRYSEEYNYGKTV